MAGYGADDMEVPCEGHNDLIGRGYCLLEITAEDK